MLGSVGMVSMGYLMNLVLFTVWVLYMFFSPICSSLHFVSDDFNKLLKKKNPTDFISHRMGVPFAKYNYRLLSSNSLPRHLRKQI